MTDEQRKALVQDYRVYAKMKPFPGPYITAADQIEADGKRIEALSAEVEQWRACARYDATMEGPVFKGWDRSALERCRRAALGEMK